MKTILARLYPNGELRVRSRHFLPPKKKTEERGRKGLISAAHSGSRRPPLDYRNEFQEANIQGFNNALLRRGKFAPGWGLTPRLTRFTLRGRRTILRAGGAMDSLPGRRAAITLTLPGSGYPAMQALADYSGYVANRLKTWIYDQFPEGCKPLWFFVWELQKRGALHIHLCVSCPDDRVFYRIKRGIKDQWISILEAVQLRSSTPMFLSPKGFDWRKRKKKIQVDFQGVRKGVAAYFSKYATKGSQAVQGHIEDGLRPSRWWGCSRSLLQLLRSMVVTIKSCKITQEQADFVMKEAYDACESSSLTYRNECPYTKEVEIISYPGLEEGRRLLREIVLNGGAVKSCRLEKSFVKSKKRKENEKKINDLWKTNESRLRVAEIVGTDSPEWEVLCRCVLDPENQPDQAFDQILAIIRNESSLCPVVDQQGGEFFLQGCFDESGNFEFDKV